MGRKDEAGTEAEEQGFLQRWSQRKLDAERESPRESTADADDGVSAGADAEIPEEALLTDDDMPPLETLHQDSDFSLFMSAGVSEALRRKALRKLFHSPKFNIRDGLCDYDDDYSGLSPLGDIVTAEMRSARERLAEKAKQRAVQWVDEQSGGASLAKNDSAGRSSGGDAAGRDPVPGGDDGLASDGDT